MLGHCIPIRNQTYLERLPFEEVDVPYWRNWFSQNWHISIYIAIVYIAFIFWCQWFMKNREPFNLRLPLAVWNFGMAAFSAFAFARFFPELAYILTKPEGGLYKAACIMEFHGMTAAFWTLVFVFSRIVQLGDTVFIVLRKKKLLMLHWYHHATALVFSWVTYQTYIPLLRFAGSMNFFAHLFLYSYYGAKAMEWKVPRKVGVLVTIIELIQMILGLCATMFVFNEHYYGTRPCYISTRTVVCATIIYSTLFVLFGNHFKETVLRKRKTA